jgi:hypothetical protein
MTDSATPGGAIDFNECPEGGITGWKKCQCGTCAVCGWPKHCALHGPLYGQPPGSKPYDHEFIPTT